ncbi:hypothetical protein SDC9_143469 [bioreactor metagenome]|uniref:Uncharacterized protein n=1 Tax=bioreactor metagenome TaxID=1076179 RepID=A0A645E417_9ZZZZ
MCECKMNRDTDVLACFLRQAWISLVSEPATPEAKPAKTSAEASAETVTAVFATFFKGSIESTIVIVITVAI